MVYPLPCALPSSFPHSAPFPHITSPPLSVSFCTKASRERVGPIDGACSPFFLLRFPQPSIFLTAALPFARGFFLMFLKPPDAARAESQVKSEKAGHHPPPSHWTGGGGFPHSSLFSLPPQCCFLFPTALLASLDRYFCQLARQIIFCTRHAWRLPCLPFFFFSAHRVSKLGGKRHLSSFFSRDRPPFFFLSLVWFGTYR